MTSGGAGRREHIYQLFAGELEDATRSLEEALLALPRSPAGERRRLIEHLERVAHTVKGSAGMVGAAVVAAICHDLEDRLGALRVADRAPAREEMTELLAGLDRLRQAGAEAVRVKGGQPLPAAPQGGDQSNRSGPGQDTVRLPVTVVEELSRRVADLRIRAGGLERLRSDVRWLVDQPVGSGAATESRRNRLQRAVGPITRDVWRAVSSVDELATLAATVPLEEVCAGLQRVVTDVSAGTGKQVRLELSVGDVGVDRRAVATLRDVLIHLVRNAVDHGIETPEARTAAGKEAEGTVRVVATGTGDQAVVRVADDGRGIQREAVSAAARRLGLDADGIEPMDAVFAPGLSTADEVTEVSGRGIGLDAVRERVESIGGSVVLTSTAGAGTEATVRVPVSMATARVLVVAAGGEHVGILSTGIRRLVRLSADDIVVAGDRPRARVGDATLRIAVLAELLDLPVQPTVVTPSVPAVAVVTGETADDLALLIDGAIREEEVLVGPLPPQLGDLPAVVGAAILADGGVMLIAHPSVLARLAADAGSGVRVEEQQRTATRILLVEDSPTTRALERSLLESAGYHVTVAEDGAAAWEQLQHRVVDVVVSDVDMPRVTGVELCELIRRSPDHRELPVVLVTSLDSADARQRGAAAGADAYVVKSGFDHQHLVATIERLARRP